MPPLPVWAVVPETPRIVLATSRFLGSFFGRPGLRRSMEDPPETVMPNHHAPEAAVPAHGAPEMGVPFSAPLTREAVCSVSAKMASNRYLPPDLLWSVLPTPPWPSADGHYQREPPWCNLPIHPWSSANVPEPPWLNPPFPPWPVCMALTRPQVPL